MSGLGRVGSIVLLCIQAYCCTRARVSHTARGNGGMGTVVTIARPVLYILAQAVDNHARDRHVRLLQHGLGTLQCDKLVRTCADHQHRGIDHPPEHPTIGHAENSRAVEDHPVVMVLQGRQQLPELERAQDFNGNVLSVARGNEIQVAQLGMTKRLLPGQRSSKHIDQTLGGATLVGVRREDRRPG